ncbi:hypothetical protein LINGRAHAP2_LOCUS34009 [Linum grandiflorum]
MIVITRTLLLFVTVAVAKGEQHYCGQENPFGYSICAGDDSCVKRLLTFLQEKTQYTEDYNLDASNPDAQSSGRYLGQASCDNKYTQADCKDCLVGAENWLTTHCVFNSHNSGYYSDGICSMSFLQFP